MKRAKGVRHMVTEGDYTLGSEHTMKYIVDVLQNCTPETYRMVLTNVAPINLTF